MRPSPVLVVLPARRSPDAGGTIRCGFRNFRGLAYSSGPTRWSLAPAGSPQPAPGHIFFLWVGRRIESSPYPQRPPAKERGGGERRPARWKTIMRPMACKLPPVTVTPRSARGRGSSSGSSNPNGKAARVAGKCCARFSRLFHSPAPTRAGETRPRSRSSMSPRELASRRRRSSAEFHAWSLLMTARMTAGAWSADSCVLDVGESSAWQDPAPVGSSPASDRLAFRDHLVHADQELGRYTPSFEGRRGAAEGDLAAVM